jgi:uncharacterized protein (DUF2141 family)
MDSNLNRCSAREERIATSSAREKGVDRQLKLAPGSQRSFQLDVPKGRWAVSAFEDRNGNGVLDMGLFGPKEPSSFWRRGRGVEVRFNLGVRQRRRVTTKISISTRADVHCRY